MNTDKGEEASPPFPDINPEGPVLLILLGASNLTLGCAPLIQFLEHHLAPRPVHVVAAHGPGRAYHAYGGFLNAVYPPLNGGNWYPAAREYAREGGPVLALVTDIGNDILYGVSSEDIQESVGEVLDCLHELKAHTLLTCLPSYFENPVSPLAFYLIRTLLFPKSRTTPEEALTSVRSLNAFVQARESQRIRVMGPLEEMRGCDKVHYSPLRAHEAWTRMGLELLSMAGIKSSKVIPRSKMIRSQVKTVFNFLFSDVLKLKAKDSRFF